MARSTLESDRVAGPAIRPPEVPTTDELAQRPASGPKRDVVGADCRTWQESLRRFYDRSPRTTRRGWPHYYYVRIQKRLAELVEPNSRVLDIGCGSGDLLASLHPSVGVGVDFHEKTVNEARCRHPGLRFLPMRGEDLHALHDTFDYVILCQVLGEIYDVQTLFQAVQSVCHARTRIIIVHYNRIWQPAVRLMEWLRLKRPTPEQNWLPADEVIQLLDRSGFQAVRTFGMTIAPLYAPLFSAFFNRVIGSLPLIHLLGLNYVVVGRSVRAPKREQSRPRSVSIVVPACNEAGHIRALIDRIPSLAEKQEIIFVEGGSRDDTWQVIQQAVADYAGPAAVKCMKQDGRGKGDAVRKGFAAATGDILLILDADLSVPPEELPAFCDALVSGYGEFVNGSRMVYLMDRRAMRFLNLLGNKTFGWLFTYLLSQPFRDTLCGTKGLLRADYARIAAGRAYFGDFDPFGDFDLLFGAARLNLKIVDVPVHYKARVYGRTNISRFRHGWMLLRMCVFAARKIKFI